MINSIKKADFGFQNINNNVAFGQELEKDLQASNSKLAKDIIERFKALTEIYNATNHCDGMRNYIKKTFNDEINPKFRNSPGSLFKVEELPYTDKKGRTKANLLITRNNVDPKNKNTIILQAHMDMVWVDERNKKSHKVNILETKGKIDGRPAKVLTADKTSLGADDQFGIASIIEIAKSDKFKNIPLQILLTEDEETTFAGVKEFDASKLAAPDIKDLKPGEIDSRKASFINMDAEYFGNVIAACCSIEKYHFANKPVPSSSLESIGANSQKSYSDLEIGLANTKGGHARDVDKGGINAFTEIFKAIDQLKDEDKKNIHIAAIEGAGEGNDKHNAIPKKAALKLIVSNDIKARIEKELKDKLTELIDRKKKDGGDPELELIFKPSVFFADKKTKVLSPDFQERLIKVFSGEPVKTGENSQGGKKEFKFLSGPYRKHESKDDPCYGDLITSQNLGVLHIKPDNSGNLLMDLAVGLRSSDKKDLTHFKEQTHNVLKYLIGEEVKQSKYDHAPVWNQVGSNLAKTAVETYSDLGIKNVRQKDNHGCLEVGTLVDSAEKAGKNLDFIAVGPNIRDPHTSNERIEIATVGKFVEFIDKLVNKLTKNDQ